MQELLFRVHLNAFIGVTHRGRLTWELVYNCMLIMIDFMKEHKVAVFLGLFWAVLFGLSLLFPYSGDDWAWGSQIGAERLSRIFAGYNGRYLGNLIVLTLTRNIVLRSFVVSVVLVLITYLLYVFAGRRRFSTLPLAAVLLMLVYYRIGAQAIVWTAGFSNYAVSALLVLVYLNASKALLASDDAAPATPAKLSEKRHLTIFRRGPRMEANGIDNE